MARSILDFLPVPLPPTPDQEQLPRVGDRRLLAALHYHYYGPISHRSIERWPLSWRIVNGSAVSSVREFLEEAQRRFDAAPLVMGGRRGARGEPEA